MKKQPCKTCPHRVPMTPEHWAKVKKANHQLNPDLTRAQCNKLTKIERREFDQLEANVENCEGYSPLKTATGFILGKLGSIEHKIKRTEAGGTRVVSWHERACNNPFLETEEHFELADAFRAVGNEDEQPSAGPFKSEKQRQAFLEDQAGTQKMLVGAAVCVGGFAIAESSGDELQVVGSGVAAAGIYLGIRGISQMSRGLMTQIRESRNPNH